MKFSNPKRKPGRRRNGLYSSNKSSIFIALIHSKSLQILSKQIVGKMPTI